MTRKKGSGGARAGAGRPPKEWGCPEQADDPLEFLLKVMNDTSLDPALRVRAAVAAAQYVHTKTHDGGKKDEQKKRSEAVASGKFAPAEPPPIDRTH